MVYGFVGNAEVVKERCAAIRRLYKKFGYGEFVLSDMKKALTKSQREVTNIRKMHNEGVVVRSGWTSERRPQRLWKLTMHSILYAMREK
jgi:hypothetical protein